MTDNRNINTISKMTNLAVVAAHKLADMQSEILNNSKSLDEISTRNSAIESIITIKLKDKLLNTGKGE